MNNAKFNICVEKYGISAKYMKQGHWVAESNYLDNRVLYAASTKALAMYELAKDIAQYENPVKKFGVSK